MTIRPTQGQAFPRIIRPPLIQAAGVNVLDEIAGLNFPSGATVTAGVNGIPDVTPTGGGGGSDLYPYAPPAMPSAYDDEFTTAALDPKWTNTIATATGGVTPDFAGTFRRVAFIGANESDVIRQPLSGNEFHSGNLWSLTCRKHIIHHTQYGGISVELDETTTPDTTGRLIGTGLQRIGGDYVVNGYSANAGAFSYGLGQQTLGKWLGGVFMHLQCTAAGILELFVSLDGVGWFSIYRTTGHLYDYNYVRVVLQGGTSANYQSASLIDFVRFNWLFLPIQTA